MTLIKNVLLIQYSEWGPDDFQRNKSQNLTWKFDTLYNNEHMWNKRKNYTHVDILGEKNSSCSLS